MLYINLLGTPEIYLDKQLALRFRTRKAQALLIYLAVTDQSWTRDALATLFWPETSDALARKNLRDILPSLRRQLGNYLLLNDELIGLELSSQFHCDVTRFSTVLEQEMQHIDTKTLAGTLALYRGEFLEGYTSARISADFELWALRERERLHQLALMGFTTLCRRQQDAGAFEAALATNRQLLKFAPWDETTHRQQMLLLAQSGQQAAALAHYETCRQILADELDVEPDPETEQLYAQIKRGLLSAKEATAASKAPLPPDPSIAHHNLPRQLTRIIGRDADIDAVQRMLKEETISILTLVGQGGVGKTRLALAVAHQLRGQAHTFFPDGIWFVPLAGIAAGATATQRIASAIAQAIGLSLSGADALSTQLIRALQEQRLLLILDNFEHLVAEQAFLLEVVQMAQQVKILVTSREQLHLHAEFLYPVAGLSVPLARDLQPKEQTGHRREQPGHRPVVELGQYASVQLFTLRVQQRLPEFHLTVQNQQKIGHICYLVGGVPLGIELAAQLYVEQGVAVLDQLIAEIEQMDPLEPPPTVATVGMDHLQTAAIDLPARQRSIRAVFLHSWQLLTPAEQELLRHCAIFRGGFTRDAVLTVANGNGANLMALVMKSLVRRDSHDRYDLHELVRQYVIDEFQQAPRLVYATAQKHARYFTNFLAGQEEKLLQEWPFYQTVQTEIYNIRAAWTWCVDQREFTELERCVICLFIYLRYAGQVHEALTLATQAMASLDPLSHGEEAADSNSRLLGHLLIYAASAGIGAGLRAESEEWLQKAVQLGAALADPSLLGQIHATLMIKYSLNLENRRSFSHAEQALHWVNVGNTHHLQPIILRVLAIGLARQGKIAESFQVAAELQQLIERRHYHCIVGESYFLASTIHEIQRDWEAELLTAQQGWDLYREGGTRFGLDNLEGNLIWAHLQLGNFAQARELAMGFGSRARRTGKQAELLYSLQSLGHAAIGLGDEQAGTAYLTDALKLAVAIDNPFRRVQIRQQLGDLNLRQGDYTQAAIHFADALQCAQALEAFDLQLLAQAGLALTHLHQGHLMQAQRMIEPVLAAEHTLTPDSPDYAFIGLAAYHILAAHEDPRATAILDDLYAEVQLQAAKIKNDAQRKAFLGKIAEHRQIVALWTEKESNRQFI